MGRKSRSTDGVSRRRFLRQAACASLGLTGLVNTLANLRLMSAAMAQTAGVTDYRALVCVFLSGGNDANNLLVPRSGTLRTQYESGRGILALPAASLHAITPSNDGRDFGLHPGCAELAQLFQSGRLAFVSNVGTLSYPIATRDEYIQGLVPVPRQLFSHSDQSEQWQSSVPDKPFLSGWGGRVADLLHGSYNVGSNVSMSISLSGVNAFQIGTTGAVTPYSMGTGAVPTLQGYGSNYSSALNPDGTYRDNDQGRRLRALEELTRLAQDNLLEEAYAGVLINARETEALVGAAMDEAAQLEAAGGFTIDQMFQDADADTSLGRQLEQVARLIAGRNALGNNRQIFFCRIGGYDNHQAMLPAHAGLMEELSHALQAFQDVMAQLGTADDVTLFTASDFNRTFTPNGTDASAGSDHAWGGHQVVLGGAVQGGKLYGTFPQLEVGAGLDVDRNRGRWIPTTSVDQYSAVLARWLGVEPNAMAEIFPNLGRFDDPFTSSTANLDFLDLT